jgi:hypothetical protein
VDGGTTAAATTSEATAAARRRFFARAVAACGLEGRFLDLDGDIMRSNRRSDSQKLTEDSEFYPGETKLKR